MRGEGGLQNRHNISTASSARPRAQGEKTQCDAIMQARGAKRAERTPDIADGEGGAADADRVAVESLASGYKSL